MIGKLYQEDAKVGLKHYTEQVRELIIQQLVKRHRNLNLEICGAFEELKKRCLDIPANTRELLQLGGYVLNPKPLHGSNNFLEKLENVKIVEIYLNEKFFSIVYKLETRI